MNDLVSLNLEYLILKLYQLIFGSGVEISDLPRQGLSLLQQLSWVAIILSIILLVAFVYTRLRLGQVHDKGHHLRHEAEIAANRPQHAKNPRWDGVIALLNSPHESDWRRAVIEADIMLQMMLTERGFSGADVGEQLRGASPAHFTTLDLAWKAHKMRNNIAHGGEAYQLTERDAQAAVDYYRRVFEEFDYI